MGDELLNLTGTTRARLDALDVLIDGPLRSAIADATEGARAMLAGSDEPFGWRFVDIEHVGAPDEIRSAAVFVLSASSAPPAHRHPNSIQHMRVLTGAAAVILRTDGDEQEVAIDDGNPWVVIGRDVEHAITVSATRDLIVVSFHTVSAEELLEVSAEGQRTYRNDL